MRFTIDVTDHGSRDDDGGDGSPYSHTWRENHSYNYKSASIAEHQAFDVGLFPGDAAVEVGEEIHLVIVSYGTGDSFGRESGKHVVLWAFSDKVRAQRLVDALDEDDRTDSKYLNDHPPMEFDGVPICTNEWKGYFESYDGASIETLFVKKG